MWLHPRKRQFSSPVFESLESRVLLAAAPVVSIAATAPSASENGDPGQFTVSRDVVTDSALKVGLAISGTAKNGSDYVKLPSPVVIPANAASVTVTIQPIDDGNAEAAETVVLTVKPGKTYVVDPAAPLDTATIADATYLAADFFPLDAELRWDCMENGNGRFYFEVATTPDGVWLLATGESEDGGIEHYQRYFQTDASGVSLAGKINDEGESTTYAPPVLWIPADMQIGQSYPPPPTPPTPSNYSSATESGTITHVIKIVGVENVAVPAGTFRSLKLQMTWDQLSDDGYKRRSVTTVWLARGVGWVKSVEKYTESEPGSKATSGTDTVNLTSWSAQSAWTARASMIDARDAHAGGVIDGTIYVFGGDPNNGDQGLNTLEAFDPSTNRWTQLAPGKNLNEVAGAVVSGKFYVIGGLAHTGVGSDWDTVNYLSQYDPATNQWTDEAAKPTAVFGATPVVYNGEIFVFGGQTGTQRNGKESLRAVDVVEAYNPATDTWRYIAKMPKKLVRAAVSVAGNRAYVFGGAVGGKAQNTTIAYDFTTGKWITKGLAALPRNQGRAFCSNNAAPAIDGRIYLVGGITGTSRLHWQVNLVDVYDRAANTWSTVSSLPGPMGYGLSIASGNTLYYIGGETVFDIDSNRIADVWALPLT